ncbi:WD40 repeat-like protein [Hesseltinella vesiculosa]|uniref:Ribosome biogenesis protein YTM1 n=1 Tax=Hesseltinella vesiculosa TaxID=101127 RepID=A0A1X2G313_9FUNG|nr:WD40 repeat-like protein [Hesseltinella vesiculosa]
MSKQEQVQIRLTTKQPKYSVNDAPILVPSTLKRYGLSELVNNLLDLDTHVPFEFLIDGEILRTSIAKYLAERHLSTENIVVIEYMESMLPPQKLASFQHDDWISSVKGYANNYLTGSYDNNVRLWNDSGECVYTLTGHKDAVKAVDIGLNQDGFLTIFSAGMDRKAMVWQITGDEPNLLYECNGHSDGIQCLTVSKSLSHFATASNDSTIRIWSNSAPTEDEASANVAHTKKKKRVENAGQIKTSATLLEGHIGAVNDIAFNEDQPNILYSGGWDHSIRSWDIDQQVNTMTKNCEKVVLAVDYSNYSGLIATGHTDSDIRLWDPRSEDGVNVKLSLRGHQKWVSSVSWAPQSAYTLCSGSYDGTVRVWDIRSKGSVYTMEEGQEKMFAVDWCDGRILSGGESQMLSIFETGSLSLSQS